MDAYLSSGEFHFFIIIRSNHIKILLNNLMKFHFSTWPFDENHRQINKGYDNNFIDPDKFIDYQQKTWVQDAIFPKEVLGKRVFPEDFFDLSDDEDVRRRNFIQPPEDDPDPMPIVPDPKDKSRQNIMRNNQGSIAGKVKKECQREDSRLFARATEGLCEMERAEFRRWVSNLNKKFKTWETIQSFLKTHLVFGETFVKMIKLFLSEEFRTEYEESLRRGQMKKKTQDFLRIKENKEFYARKFSLIMAQLQGTVLNIRNDMKKSRKTLGLI